MKVKRIILSIIIVSLIISGTLVVSASDVSPFTIIGTDDRVKVTDTTVSPYNAVANLTLRYSNGTVRYGTGFLIGPNTIATAGHVVYDRANGLGSPTSITVRLGDTPTSHPYGTQTVYSSNFYYPSAWKNSGGISNDYGVIKLNTAVNNITPFTISDQDTPVGTAIKIAGYDYKTAQQWKTSGTVVETFTGRIDYRMDTLPGMSGSPVYIGTRTVVAINTYDAGTKDEVVDEDWPGNNTGTKITSTVKAFFESHL